MVDIKTALRSTGWLAISIVVTVLAWIAGLITYGAQINSCNWAERNGWFVFLAGSFVLVIGFYLIHRLPWFNLDNAVPRSQILAGLLLGPWFIGAFVSGPNMLGAIERGRQKRTMADMRSVSSLLDNYYDRHQAYPQANSMSQLTSILGTEISLPRRDGWGQPYLFRSNGAGYTLVSRTRCGIQEVTDLSEYEPGVTSGHEADIVVVNGRFFRYPEGTFVD
jgi:hypothetical protein